MTEPAMSEANWEVLRQLKERLSDSQSLSVFVVPGDKVKAVDKCKDTIPTSKETGTEEDTAAETSIPESCTSDKMLLLKGTIAVPNLSPIKVCSEQGLQSKPTVESGKKICPSGGAPPRATTPNASTHLIDSGPKTSTPRPKDKSSDGEGDSLSPASGSRELSLERSADVQDSTIPLPQFREGTTYENTYPHATTSRPQSREGDMFENTYPQTTISGSQSGEQDAFQNACPQISTTNMMPCSVPLVDLYSSEVPGKASEGKQILMDDQSKRNNKQQSQKYNLREVRQIPIRYSSPSLKDVPSSTRERKTTRKRTCIKITFPTHLQNDTEDKLLTVFCELAKLHGCIPSVDRKGENNPGGVMQAKKEMVLLPQQELWRLQAANSFQGPYIRTYSSVFHHLLPYQRPQWPVNYQHLTTPNIQRGIKTKHSSSHTQEKVSTPSPTMDTSLKILQEQLNSRGSKLTITSTGTTQMQLPKDSTDALYPEVIMET